MRYGYPIANGNDRSDRNLGHRVTFDGNETILKRNNSQNDLLKYQNQHNYENRNIDNSPAWIKNKDTVS